MYGSWIYNYLCNQCLSSLNLWVWILLMVRCTQFVSDLRQIVVFSRYSGFLHQLNWSPRYIIEILLKVALSTITLTLYFMDYFYYYLNSLLYMEVKKTWPQNDNQNNQTFSVIFSEGHVFQTSLSMYKMYHNYQLSVVNNLQKNIYTTNENNVNIFHLSFFLLLFFLFYPGKLYFHNII